MTNEGRRGPLARRASMIGGLIAALACVAPAASADSITNDGFESFALGDPVGQGGWTANDVGGYAAANFDIDIVDPSAVWGSTLGTRALRMSNGITSPGFGNQLQTFSLANEAGEASASTSGLSGGTRQSRLSGTVTFASATQVYQPGMVMSFSPDRGDGVRMSYFRLSDLAGGLQLEVGYYDTNVGNFVYEVLATGLSRTAAHTLTFSIDFVDGVDNDVLWARVGTAGCGTWNSSGSWEDYHREEGGGTTHPVDSILFRLGGAAQLSNLGGGFLFDDLSLESSTVPAMPGPGVLAAIAAPSAAVNGQHIDVGASAPAANGCEPITEYRATLTPSGGGAPIVIISATPDFDFDAVPPGSYSVTVAVTTSAGTSAESVATDAVVLPLAEPSTSPEPSPSITDEDGDGNPDGELAATGPTLLPLALAAAALVAAGVALRRRPARN